MRFTGYCGSAITYDAIGNPLSYKGYTLKWTGRKLDSLSKSGLNVTYKYDSDGIRTSKTVNGVKYTYYYEGSQLRFEQRGNEKLYYSYNGYGHLSGITYVNSAGTVNNYYVMTNTRGDVEQIYNADGTLVATYSYDAWGNVLAVKNVGTSIIGDINPIRYRGYYYDVETKLYYLNSRYYDAEVGRFVSADDVGVVEASTTPIADKNMFAYCDNNPVVRVDVTGYVWETAFDIITLGTSVVEVCINPTDPWAWVNLVADTVDLIPIVTGVGEVTRAIRVSNKVVDTADDVVDTAKVIYKAADKTSEIKTATGAYEITYKSGKNYVGKGGFGRAIQSSIEHMKPNRLNEYLGDTVTSIRWYPTADVKSAFLLEYAMQTQKGVNNLETYNLIWSPGKKRLGDMLK